MQEVSTAREILPESAGAAVVFTRGRNFSLDDDGTGHTGYWKISTARDFEKVVLYLREESEAENRVYVADAAGFEGPNEEDRYLLKFVNATLVGQTASNWYEFTGMDTNNPVVYLETEVEDESTALEFDPGKLPEMLSLVRNRYPDWDGIDDPRFLEEEINYKQAASDRARDLLSQTILQELLDAGDYDAFIGQLESVGQSTNLLYLSHPSAGDLNILYDEDLDAPSFCKEAYALLHGPEPVQQRLEHYFEYVEQQELPNKWTFPTYFLFLLYPDREMFIKPMATRWFIELINGPETYPWTPSAAAYVSMRDVFYDLRDALAQYGADDLIDAQSFMWTAYRVEQELEEPSEEGQDLTLAEPEETRYWRITLPTDLKTTLADGTSTTMNVWETCVRHSIAAIGFEGNKENSQVQKFMEIRPDDRVVAFLRDKTIGGVGRVISGFDEKLFEERPAADDYFHDDFWFRIGVDWQPHRLDVDTLPEAVANMFGQQTVLELSENDFQTVMDKMEEPYEEGDFLAKTHLTREAMVELRDMLLEKRQLVLYGPPGTGKTYVAQHLARLLTGLADPPAQQLEIVQFHPAYGYEDFIEGIRPRSKPVGDGHFVVNYPIEAGAFRRFCQAARDIDGPCIFIIDEINRGNIPRIFGELMLLLEYRDQQVTLPYSGEPFSIPKNVYIIGTMNTADRSIALVDFALRRRFHFFRFDANPDLFQRWAQRQPGLLERLPYLPELYRQLSQQAIDDPNYAIGPSYFMDPDLTETRLEQIWRRSIVPYLEEYYFEQEASVTPWRWESREMRAIRMREHLEFE